MKTSTKVAGVIGAVTATVLSAYFYSKTPTGKKKVAEIETKTKAWANHAKRDILKHVKTLKSVSQKDYFEVINVVMEKYKLAKKLATKEVELVSKELKKHWNDAKKEIAKINKQTKDDLVG